MLDLWEIFSAPDEYIPGTFDEEIAKYFEEKSERLSAQCFA